MPWLLLSAVLVAAALFVIWLVWVEDTEEEPFELTRKRSAADLPESPAEKALRETGRYVGKTYEVERLSTEPYVRDRVSSWQEKRAREWDKDEAEYTPPRPVFTTTPVRRPIATPAYVEQPVIRPVTDYYDSPSYQPSAFEAVATVSDWASSSSSDSYGGTSDSFSSYDSPSGGGGDFGGGGASGDI
jgi:uncharacterized membrane protein YgcG